VFEGEYQGKGKKRWRKEEGMKEGGGERGKGGEEKSRGRLG
jgi:hypothetical protein